MRKLLHRSGRSILHSLVYAGTDLNVCGPYLPGPQCCSQMNENALGMTLNNALNTRDDDLGIELRAMGNATADLYSGLTGKPMI